MVELILAQSQIVKGVIGLSIPPQSPTPTAACTEPQVRLRDETGKVIVSPLSPIVLFCRAWRGGLEPRQLNDRHVSRLPPFIVHCQWTLLLRSGAWTTVVWGFAPLPPAPCHWLSSSWNLRARGWSFARGSSCEKKNMHEYGATPQPPYVDARSRASVGQAQRS
ncbi:hypothetical protein CONLIGDRAFT_93706 [Coniochaeta ligniaria NRRL 30616]|uniref:Uncharacterized protein n=1 Tax=Coniochaeta ligniaria NRRL 30616 TaxID=1408157 RepID=A0A1J7IDT5_9PEZI|nr:hypothetical protein CONLIGDRAFT_93706 [Coniochaeta ligniaria NRRL 30616]